MEFTPILNRGRLQDPVTAPGLLENSEPDGWDEPREKEIAVKGKRVRKPL